MEKLLAIVSLSQRLYGRWLFHKLLSGAIIVVMLTITASMMIGTLVIACFYAIYIALLHYGSTQQAALFVTGLAGLAATVLIVLLIYASLRRMRRMPQDILKQKFPVVSDTGNVVDAFIEGFLRPAAADSSK